MPTVSVLSLGGTIAMAPPSEQQAPTEQRDTTEQRDATHQRGAAEQQGAVPTLDAEELLASVPGLAETGIQVRARSVRNVPGASLGFGDLTELVRLIGDEVEAGAHGVVITQGTDTIEETAFFLDSTVPGPAPVVVTGAMRNPTMAGADGPANLLAAVRLAASPAARELGCVVVMSDEIHAARRVRKTHTNSTAAFGSPDTGPIGYLVEGLPRVLAHPGQRVIVPPGPALTGLRIPVLPAALGDDGENLRRLAEGCDGLVVAGLGVGHVPAGWVPELTALAERVPVVLASRTGAGPVLSRTYGFPGSEQDLRSRGLIGAGFLDPFKARVLLHLLVADSAPRERILDSFAAVAQTA